MSASKHPEAHDNGAVRPWSVASACVQRVDHGAGKPLTLAEAVEQVVHPLTGLTHTQLVEVGVDWMTGKGRRECIPPIYALWVGRQLMAAVEGRVAA